MTKPGYGLNSIATAGLLVLLWAAPAVGRTFRDALRSGGEGPAMVVVPAGSFQMGAPWYEEGRHWRDPGYRQSGEHPVVCVSWKQVQAYVAWLTRESGAEYRLLSEAEWEYAARGGTETARYWGERETEQCRYANRADAAVKRKYDVRMTVECDDGHIHTAPVGSYTKNSFGLSDVLGNVGEWVEDCWNDSYAGAPTDGTVWEQGECSFRVVRGGSWYGIPRTLRSADRGGTATGNRDDNLGFRVARSLTP